MNQKCLFALMYLLLLAFLPSLTAQDKSATKGFSESEVAFGVTDMDLIDQLMPVVAGVGGTAREILQQQSVKSYMMPVRKVGVKGSELSYMMATCLEFYVNLDKNYKLNLSPDYISLNIENSGRNVTLLDGFQFLANEGTVNAAIVPYEASQLTSAVYSTQKFKINNYLHIFREVTPARQRVYEARKALMKGNPVLVEVRSDNSIKQADGRSWSPGGSTSNVFPLLIVGYDAEQQAFEAMSCWGRNWGIDGYIWISYSDFGKYASNGYVMVPESAY